MNIKLEKISGIRFDYSPQISNRSDAIELLDILIEADFFENVYLALEALKEAIQKEII
jgi:hypothetical protein